MSDYDPAHPPEPNYRDVRGWLIGIGIFIVALLALVGLTWIVVRLLGG